MSGFDTSGVVLVPNILGRPRPIGSCMATATRWPDLDAFAQGYLEAMARDGASLTGEGDPFVAGFRFGDLAGETLEVVQKDCAEVRNHAEFFADDPGASFWLNRKERWPAWRDRRAGLIARFPPVFAVFCADGKVRLS